MTLEINRHYNDKLEAKDAEIAALKKRVQELESSLLEWMGTRLQPDGEVLRLVGLTLQAMKKEPQQ